MNTRDKRVRRLNLTIDICLVLFETAILAWSIYTHNVSSAILIGIAAGIGAPAIVKDFIGGDRK